MGQLSPRANFAMPARDWVHAGLPELGTHSCTTYNAQAPFDCPRLNVPRACVVSHRSPLLLVAGVPVVTAAAALYGGQRRVALAGGGRPRPLVGGRLEAAAAAVVLVLAVLWAGAGVVAVQEQRRGPRGSTWAARDASRHVYDRRVPYTCVAEGRYERQDAGGWS